MYKVSRVHPPDKEVLTDISLSFFPGAKIGVLGYNGAGKSTPAADHGRRRHRVPRRGAARTRARPSGCSSRSRSSTSPRTCTGNVEDGVRELRDLLDRYNEVAANYSEETADEFARLQDRDRRRRRLEPRHDAGDGDGRAAPAARPTPT